MSNFVFTTCQVGFENIVKWEFSKLHPELNFAFSKPGFLTFKSPEDLLEFHTPSVFSHSHGLSTGKIEALEEIKSILRENPNIKRIHFFSRPKKNYEVNEMFEIWNGEEDLLKKMGFSNSYFESPNLNDLILVVIQVEPNQFWTGFQVFTANSPRFSGGRSFKSIEKKVSRAYYKLKDTHSRFNLEFYKNNVVLEVGSAPGGSCQYLLEQGLKVFGLDRGKMHETVLNHRSFVHIASSFHDVSLDLLPRECQWVIVDIHAPPPISLQVLEKTYEYYQNSLKGMVLNLKLTDLRFAEKLETYRTKLSKYGFREIHFHQNLFHREELSLIIKI